MRLTKVQRRGLELIKFGGYRYDAKSTKVSKGDPEIEDLKYITVASLLKKKLIEVTEDRNILSITQKGLNLLFGRNPEEGPRENLMDTDLSEQYLPTDRP